jgi:enamine deaminase RidA (YjgF/YER057c/UK114 family)
VFVAATPGFTEHPKVANGASQLLVDVLGEAGSHARAAVGVASLPLGSSVEVALTASVDPG